jgi:hypothetical protein
MGKKMVGFAQLGAARSRQDESMEVGEVGSKRPSSGCNGVHVLSLYPLTWRSLVGSYVRTGVRVYGPRYGCTYRQTTTDEPTTDDEPTDRGPRIKETNTPLLHPVQGQLALPMKPRT